MIRLLALAAALLLPNAALAQHAHHARPKADPHAAHRPAPAKPRQAASRKPERAAPKLRRRAPPAKTPKADPHAGHAMGAAPKVQPTPAPVPVDPHAGHAMPPPAADPHAGHAMPEPAPDPHAGHAMPEPAADPHAGHAPAAPPPVAPPPAGAFTGPENAADAIYDPALMAAKRRTELIEAHGGMTTGALLIDELEYRARSGRDGVRWDAQGWYGSDYDKLWLKSEGEGSWGERLEQAEVQALYSRAIGPFFDLQAGVRQDLTRGERTHLALGLQGLARYWFEVDGALFLSTEGELTARIEAEYDQRITNKLILQPMIELDLAAQDVAEAGIGAGLSSMEAGLRLRYQFVPEFAPYVGIGYERRIGRTARFARAAGEDTGGAAVMLGVRTWF